MSATPVDPSLERIARVAFRANHLVSVFESYIDGEYPDEARELGLVLASVTSQVVRELDSILADSNPPTISDDHAQQAKGLFQVLQRLYTYVEFLHVAESRLSPPSVQSLLSAFAARHFPRGQGRVIALVTPQWAYNLGYFPLLADLRRFLRLETIDRKNRLGVDLPKLFPLLSTDVAAYDRAVAREIIAKAWERYLAERPDDARSARVAPSPPDEVAILSFAGLDTADTLQFSILAHELAHFVHLSGDADLRNAAAEFWVDQGHIEVAVPRRLSDSELQYCWSLANERIAVAVREIVADLVAVRMLGLGFALAQVELLLSLFDWPENQLTSSGYPGVAYRFQLVLEELARVAEAAGRPVVPPSDGSSEEGAIATFLRDRLAALTLAAETALSEPFQRRRCLDFALDDPDVEEALNKVERMAIDRGVPRVKEIVATLLPVDRLRPAGPNLYRRVQAIRDGLPPYLPGDDSESFGEIMAAGWARTLHDADRLHAGSGASDEYQRDCRLVLKALELASASLHSIEQERGWVPSVSAATGIGGVLGREALVDRCQRSSIAQRLVVMPPGKNAFQAASVDLRLGQWFKVARRTRLKSIDLTSASGRRTATQAAHEEFFLPFGQSLTVHPGDFVLAVTLEYIAIPCDLMGTVEGRSGAGRTGLTIATATPVSPGFKGSVVLELAHAGAVPITIAPGLGIAQMLLYQLSAPTEAYSGRFQCQTRP